VEDISGHLEPLVQALPATGVSVQIAGNLTFEGPARTAKRGRRFENAVSPLSIKQRNDRARAGTREARKRCIAVLDMETDPFDDKTKSAIFPFVCELYSDQFGSIVIWEENVDRFITKVVAAIESLPDHYTIYAHNGGKFDYLFLISKIKGDVKFKGRSIMVAKIGNHELRDSLHILPEKLAAWKKDTFDYSKLKKENRHKFRKDILEYLHNDCVYLFDIVKSFIQEFGLKLSIGQAAFSELKKSYKVEHITEQSDDFLRRYFFGGRVECLAGRGLFDTDYRGNNYKLYDVNSMYPSVMANFQHPIGKEYGWRRGEISDQTCFIDIRCKSNGCFVQRADDYDADVANGYGRFHTTIWEYDVAVRYGLVEDAEILGVVDFQRRSDFSKFVVPMYQRRQRVKADMAALRVLGKDTLPEFEELKKQDLFLKYLLNNAYGKFAQNPRRFKEFYYTETGCAPPKEWMEFLAEMNDDDRHKYSFPCERTDDFLVWSKPSPGRRYNNVATAASITGAARAVLLEAIQNSVDPIYCDTDSLICKSLSGVDIHKSNLGSWDLEAEFDRVIIAGKKTYACEVRGYDEKDDRRYKLRAKGGSGLKWKDFEAMLRNETINNVNRAPTITKTGHQHYLLRRIKATAPLRNSPVIVQRKLAL
jgi:hypothetical protein